MWSDSGEARTELDDLWGILERPVVVVLSPEPSDEP